MDEERGPSEDAVPDHSGPLEVTFVQAAAVDGEPELATRGSTTTGPPAILDPDDGSAIEPADVSASDDVYAAADPSPDFPYQRFDIAVEPTEGLPASAPARK